MRYDNRNYVLVGLLAAAGALLAPLAAFGGVEFNTYPVVCTAKYKILQTLTPDPSTEFTEGKYVGCAGIEGTCQDRGSFNKNPRGMIDRDGFKCQKEGGYVEDTKNQANQGLTCPPPPPGAPGIFRYAADDGGQQADKCAIDSTVEYWKCGSFRVPTSRCGSTDVGCFLGVIGNSLRSSLSCMNTGNWSKTTVTTRLSTEDPSCPSAYPNRKVVSGHDYCDRWKVTWDPAKVTNKNGNPVDFVTCPPHYGRFSWGRGGGVGTELNCWILRARCKKSASDDVDRETIGHLDNAKFTCKHLNDVVKVVPCTDSTENSCHE